MVADAWRTVLVTGASITGLFVLVPQASAGRFGWSVIFLAAAALSYHGWRANGARPPTDWYIWIGALAAWGAGGLVGALGAGLPAWALGAPHVLGYALFALGVIWFQQTRVVGLDRDWMVDATIVCTAVGVLLWTTLDGAGIASLVLTPIEQTLYALAALVHMGFLAFSARLLILTRGRLLKNWLGGSAAVLATAASAGHFVLRVQGSDPSPPWVLALWALAAIVFCSMPNEATQPTYKREGLVEHSRPYTRFAVLASAMVAGMGAVVLHDGINGARTIPVGGSLLLTLLVLWRLLGLIMAREHGKRELEARAAQQAMVADLGHEALGRAQVIELLVRTVEGVARTLEVDHCGVVQLLPGKQGLQLRARAGRGDTVVGDAVTDLVGQQGRLPAAAALACDEPVVVTDLAGDGRFDVDCLIGDLPAASAVCVQIGGTHVPYGVLEVASARQRVFTDDEVGFLQATANVLAVAIERRAQEEEMRHRALHDSLTGLPNRALMADRLRRALAVRGRQPGELGVLFIDLDHFKPINDEMGHAAGDQLLVAVAERLLEVARADDTVARFAGDEFVIVCERLQGEEDIIGIAERIDAALRRPFTIQGQEVHMTASLGIALANAGHDSEGLLRAADSAMYQAKQKGRSYPEPLHEVMDARVRRRRRMEQDLHGAPDRGELKVVYQPIVELATDRMVGVEALLRWHHPREGWVAPAEFIPIAEESGLIWIIGEWVLHQACRQQARWQQERPDDQPFVVHVNLSGRQLVDPRLGDVVQRSLEETGVDPSCLGLEMAESAALADPGAAMRNLALLADLGVRLSVEDFGSGASSSAHLERFPVDVVKVDAGFIEGLGKGTAEETAEDEARMRALVGLALARNLDVLGEGVETEAQLAAVRQLGCGLAQGYLLARPMLAEQIDELLSVGRVLKRPA